MTFDQFNVLLVMSGSQLAPGELDGKIRHAEAERARLPAVWASASDKVRVLLGRELIL